MKIEQLAKVLHDAVRAQGVCFYGEFDEGDERGDSTYTATGIDGQVDFVALAQAAMNWLTTQHGEDTVGRVLDPIVPKPGNGPESEALSR